MSRNYYQSVVKFLMTQISSLTQLLFPLQNLFICMILSLITGVPNCYLLIKVVYSPHQYLLGYAFFKACDSSHSLKSPAALNVHIKAQCATAFHHLFIWANSITYGDSMILDSEETHSALHPLKALLALTNCIFIKDCRQAILSQTRLVDLQGLPWTCN